MEESCKIVDANFIRELRKKLDMSILLFSSVVGAAESVVEQWESGKLEPSRIEKEKILLLDLKDGLIDVLYSVGKSGGVKNE